MLTIPVYKTLAEWAAAQLRELIVSGRLTAGQRLYEHELAARMGVSRTPVREALRHLEREGLVSLTPNRETLVTAFTARDVREIYQVRAALEGMAARLAAEKRDDAEVDELSVLLDHMEQAVKIGETTVAEAREAYNDADMRFHDVVLRAAHNARLAEAVHSLRSQTRRYLLFGLRTWNPQGMRHNLSEHRAVAEAIRDREPDLAESHMRAHITVSSGITVRALEAMERSIDQAAS